ncbi:MAG: TRAP transporter permease [Rhodospirillales bacterium]
MSEQSSGAAAAGEPRQLRRLGPLWRAVLCAAAVLATFLALNQILNWQLFVGVVIFENTYLFLIAGLLLSLVFIVFPARAGRQLDRVPWYDAGLFLLTLALAGFFAWNGETIADKGWDMAAPREVAIVSLVLWAILLECGRRTGGTTVFVVILAFSIYPIFADRMPGPLAGFSLDLFDTAAFHIMSGESLLGLPTRTFAQLFIGYLVFGAALQLTGAGRFFIDFAFSLLGRHRGGAAKVAILSSGLLGSVSGSVVTNVLTTGAMTIPAMKRTGFSPQYAGGVEACASTGGVLMPPIMGATAFVMASFLEISYATVAIAATVPSVLYYFGLFMQIDAHAARRGLAGLPRAELPSLGRTMREGWHYLFVFAFLVWMLAVEQQESLAPFYATVLLIAANQLYRATRWRLREVLRFVEATGRLFAEIMGVLGGIGLIIGALSMTGVAGTLTNDLVFLAGDNPYILLLTGAITSFILGFGMTVTAAYIFLAVVLAPSLVKVGLDPLAVHLFLLYWGMLSFITPPVAIGAFAAASLAGSKPMATGFEAMRLGSIIYFVPFFFVLNPALIFHGPWQEVLFVIATALAGVALIAAGLQGWLVGAGAIRGGLDGWAARILLVAGGLLLAIPGGERFGFSNAALAGAALVAVLPAVALVVRQNRRGPRVDGVPAR